MNFLISFLLLKNCKLVSSHPFFASKIFRSISMSVCLRRRIMLETKIAIRSHLGGDCETRTPPFPSRYKERIERLKNLFLHFTGNHRYLIRHTFAVQYYKYAREGGREGGREGVFSLPVRKKKSDDFNFPLLGKGGCVCGP